MLRRGILLGGLGLAALERLIATRESFWKSEKTKWEAKSAKVDYEEKVRQVEAALDREHAAEEAIERLAKLIKFANKSREIRSITVEIDGRDDEPDNPGTLKIPTGRKFRQAQSASLLRMVTRQSFGQLY